MLKTVGSRSFLKLFFLPILAACLLFSQDQAQAFKCKDLGYLSNLGDDTGEYTIMTYNFANLFLREAAEERKDVRALLKQKKFKFKSEKDLVKQQRIIEDVNPDIIIGTEIHKIEDANLLLESNPNLKDKYFVFLKEGNDRRGINIAIFVKKSLGFRHKLTSHKDLRWKDPATGFDYPLFSRDLPMLTLTKPGEEIPSLIIIGNHAKSKRDGPMDNESTRYRTAQYEGAAKILDAVKLHYQTLFGKDIPVIMAGDFNTDTVKGREVAPILSRLKSAFDKVKGRVAEYNERITHFYFGPKGRQGHALDGIFVSDGVEVDKAYVYQYKDEAGRTLPDPRSFQHRETYPGDHEPVVARVRTRRLNAK